MISLRCLLSSRSFATFVLVLLLLLLLPALAGSRLMTLPSKLLRHLLPLSRLATTRRFWTSPDDQKTITLAILA